LDNPGEKARFMVPKKEKQSGGKGIEVMKAQIDDDTEFELTVLSPTST
jgi:hypothetical protein